MPEKLFVFMLKDSPEAREWSHAALHIVLQEGVYPDAECRENSTTGEYSVWSGPEVRTPAPAQPAVLGDQDLTKVAANLSDAQLDRLATLLAAKLKG